MSGPVEVFADVGCPFTHVSLRNWVRERSARGRDDVALVVRAWPLELVNGAPLNPGLIGREVAALQASVAPDLFAGFRPDRFPSSTRPAMELTAAAYDQDVVCGEAVALGLRAALFEEGQDVADPAVLAELASANGVPWPVADRYREVVLAQWAEGQRRGVVGSPHFFAGGQPVFCPMLRIEHRDEDFAIEVDQAGVERLWAASFE